MKNLSLILILLFLSSAVMGQSSKKKLFKKKKDKVEQTTTAASTENVAVSDTDFRKVGKYIKNAGWSFFGALLTLPMFYEFFVRNDNSTTPVDPDDEDKFTKGFIAAGAYTSAFCMLNIGVQTIKAGWELQKKID